MKNILNFKDFINESNKSDEEDCFISSNGFKLSVSCGGKHQGDFVEDDDALKCVNDWQKKNDWYPTIWWVSDHGNMWPIDSKGNEIKMTEEDEENDNDEEFITHGYYTVSNAGGYEIQLSDDGESARVKDSYGSENPKISDWLDIEYVLEDEDDPKSELVPVIDPDGYNIPLNQVMRK